MKKNTGLAMTMVMAAIAGSLSANTGSIPYMSNGRMKYPARQDLPSKKYQEDAIAKAEAKRLRKMKRLTEQSKEKKIC